MRTYVSRLGLTFWHGALAWPWPLSCRVRFVSAWWLSVPRGRFPGMLPLAVVGAGVAVVRVRGRLSSGVGAVRAVRRRGGEGLAAPAPGFRGQALGGAALVFFLPGVPGGRMRWLRTTSRRGGEQHQGGQAHEAAPAAADVVGGGVLGGGEAAFGAGAAGVGAAVRGGRVVVFLRGLGGARPGGTVIVCWVQQACGCCGGWRISGRSRSRVIDGGPERAADLARGGGALHAVVAVGVVRGEAAELVAGQSQRCGRRGRRRLRGWRCG